MSSTVIDLTDDSPIPSPHRPPNNENFSINAKSTNGNTTSTRLAPLSEIRNNAQARVQRNEPLVSKALTDAINTIDQNLLRTLVKKYCDTNVPLKQELQSTLLVPGRDIVRYHDGSDSENDADSEIDSEEEFDDDGELIEKEVVVKPIAVGYKEYVPRYATCENCKEKFDITANDYRECEWHTGAKEIDYDADTWADHDEDCHGRIDDLEDHEDYAEGFKWSCCDADGSSRGCKITKHKVKVNVIVEASVGHKRKAEEELVGPQRTR